MYILMNFYTFFFVLTNWGTFTNLKTMIMILHLIAPTYTMLLSINFGGIEKWMYYLKEPVYLISYLIIFAELATLGICYLQYIRVESDFM